MAEHYNKIVILGLGYIGLPTAALIARKGLNVVGVDINKQVVETINKGAIHIVEPSLDGLVKYVIENGKLRAESKPEEGDVFIITVPTPFHEDRKPDITYVADATRSIAPHLKKGDLYIIESTSPVGTTEKMKDLIEEIRPDLIDELYIAYCPERVLPGKVLHELEHNDRVIGGINVASSRAAVSFYRNFVSGDLFQTDSRTAEMCKLVENSHRDVNIAFANELSMICDEAGINVWELIRFANKHPRVNILSPGTGVGGHCIAVDPWFIISEFPDKSNLIRKAREVNTEKTHWVIERIMSSVRAYRELHKAEPKVALMGLAFKPNIDDLRESPAIEVVRALMVRDDLQIMVSEPNLDRDKDPILGLDLHPADQCYENSEICVFLVAHNEYDPEILSERKGIIELDFCGIRKKSTI